MNEPKIEASERPGVSASGLRVPGAHSDWCPGCGDFGILSALHQAIAGLGLQPHEVVTVGGIGCSGKAQYYVNTYGVHSLHGRALPCATGIKLANHTLTVIVMAGDGDALAIGAGHFVNAGRRNVDLTYIVFNNGVYGLTKGQAAPTLPLGLQTKSLPEPNIQGQVNALLLALTSGYTWIGRGYAYDVKRLADLIQQAIQHFGLSYLEVLQPCPTYNNLHTKEWYAGADRPDHQPRIYDVNEEGYDPLIPPDPDEDLVRAKMLAFLAKAQEWGDRIPTGVLLENRQVSSYEDRIDSLLPGYCALPPAKRQIADEAGCPTANLAAHLAELTVP
jgi:2-oxoglutarate/2-oxoacid ferredoxin oxidoreductase subunit beta